MNWRPDRLIKWAGRRGLVVNEKQLQEHFSNHLEPSIKTTPLLKEKTKSRIRNVQTKQTNNNKRSKQSRGQKPSLTTKLADNQQSYDQTQTDEYFLNTVIGLVLKELTEGEFDLKVEHGFKAIELKQKLAENSNVENLLLELLNEIRRQELPFLHQNKNH